MYVPLKFSVEQIHEQQVYIPDHRDVNEIHDQRMYENGFGVLIKSLKNTDIAKEHRHEHDNAVPNDDVFFTGKSVFHFLCSTNLIKNISDTMAQEIFRSDTHFPFSLLADCIVA